MLEKYEKMPRKLKQEDEKEVIHLLPIKDKRGLIPQTMEKPGSPCSRLRLSSWWQAIVFVLICFFCYVVVQKADDEEEEQEEPNAEEESEQGESEAFDMSSKNFFFLFMYFFYFFFEYMWFHFFTTAEQAQRFLTLTPEEQLKLRTQKLMERKLRIASLGSVILADPDSNVRCAWDLIF